MEQPFSQQGSTNRDFIGGAREAAAEPSMQAVRAWTTARRRGTRGPASAWGTLSLFSS